MIPIKLTDINMNLAMAISYVQGLLDDNHGVNHDKEIEKTKGEIEELQIIYEDKIRAILFYIEGIKMETENLKSERERMDKIVKTNEKKIDWFNNYILSSMIGRGAETIKYPDLSISIGKSESTVINCLINDLPAHLIRTKTILEADKEALKKELQGGVVIDGCYLSKKQFIKVYKRGR